MRALLSIAVTVPDACWSWDVEPISVPEGLTDVAGFPALLGELLRRGYSDADVRAIAGGNLLRTMRDAEAVAARLQVERAPSEAIEDLDGPG
jgi:membrane dipeptidase